MRAEFEFEPKQRVKVVAYGLNCDGRVIQCSVA